jgi:hypothetical protein
VIRKPGDETARGHAVVEAHRQAHDVIEHFLAQGLDHPSRHPGHAVGGTEAGYAAQHEQADDCQRHQADDGRILVDETAVKQGPDQCDKADVGQREQTHHQHGNQEYAPMRQCVSQQAAVGNHRLVGGLRRRGHGLLFAGCGAMVA